MTEAAIPPDQLQRLITLNRALMHQHLLRGIAHDVRNNLQVVALGVSLGDEQASANIVHRIEKSLDDIVATLDLLGALGRAPTDERADADLAEVLGEVCRLADLQRNFPTLRVALEGPVPPASVAMRRSDLLLVLLNLVANAKQASRGAADPVTISASLPINGSVTIEVADNGPGIPAAAGRPFVSTGAPEHHGGLGLVVSRALAERTGGSLDWDRADGRTVVRLSLPAIGRG